MHKVIFILTSAENSEEAHSQADSFIQENLINDASFDWYQGIIESQRWHDLEHLDSPIDARSLQATKIIRENIKNSQADILEWIQRAHEELFKRGTIELGDTLSSFRIAASLTQGNIFDSTNWSCGSAIVDFQSLSGFWKNNTEGKIFLCGFDIHY